MKKRRKMPIIVRKANQAIRIAIKKVMREHREKGLPIYIWQNGKVVRVPAHRIRP